MADQRTFGEKVSDAVAQFGGSWKFIISGACFITVWVSINTISFLSFMQFDPYPFILLNLLLSLVAAFQAPFIMMSQNRADKKQDKEHKELFAEIKALISKEIQLDKKMYSTMKRVDTKLPMAEE